MVTELWDHSGSQPRVWCITMIEIYFQHLSAAEELRVIQFARNMQQEDWVDAIECLNAFGDGFIRFIFNGDIFPDDLSLLFYQGLICGQGTIQVNVDIISGSQ
jgi:hypothetical protein